MKKWKLFLFAAMALCSVLAFGMGTQEEGKKVAYPVKPIKLVVPWPPGGSTDVTARAMAKVAERLLGQPVIVENRAGGATTIGSQEVANAPGDGYTILVATVTGISVQPHIVDVNYTPASFKGVGQVAVRDMIIVASSKKTWNTMADYIAEAKRNPDKLLFAATQGGVQHLLYEQVVQQAQGFSTKLFPVQGEAQSITAVLGGTVDIALLGSYEAAKGQLEAGEMKALATFSESRSKSLPNTPTLMELGYKVSGYPWTGLLIPASTPADVVLAVQEAFEKVINDPEFVEVLHKTGQTPMYIPGDEFMKKIEQEYINYGVVIQKQGMGKK